MNATATIESPMTIVEEVYAAPNGIPLRYDFVRPQTAGALPLVVCLHGGGWISGDKSDLQEILSMLASAGFAAAAPSYRLAPLHTFPAAVADAMAFVRYARENAKELGIDPNRIASFGNSAGAHLACMLGVLDRLPDEPEAPSSRVNAVVDLCGITDIRDPRGRHLPISWSFVDQFMELPYDGNEDRYCLASPLCHVSREAAPFLIMHGEDDDVVPIAQSESLAAALREHDVPFEFLRLPGEGHSFSMMVWPDIAHKTVRFLRETL
jgi:acetyl esterase/lipase